MTRFSFTICSMTFLQSRGGLSFPKRNNETEKQQRRLKIIWAEYGTSDSRLSPLKLGETLHGLIWWSISVFLVKHCWDYFFFFFRCPLDGKTMNYERRSSKVHLLCLFHLSYLISLNLKWFERNRTLPTVVLLLTDEFLIENKLNNQN